MINPTCSLLIATLMLMAPASAQLNGTYTIDNQIPTGGLNYVSFADAVTDLQNLGVNGPVAFLVAATPTAYSGFVMANPIAGGGSGNPIAFIGVGGPVISGSAPSYTQVVRLGGTSVSSTSTGPSYVSFEGFVMTGASSGAGFIATGCNNVVVRSCVAHACGSGFYLAASTNSTIEDCEVYNCGNTCGSPGSSTYSGAIGVYYNAHGNTVQRSRVHDCTGNGIFVGSSGSTTAPLNNVVVNNFVWNTPGLGSYPGGIALRRAGGALVAHNSVWMPAGTSFAGINQMGATADPLPAEISNNIVKHDGTGGCMRIELATGGLPAVLDTNLYDAGPTAAVGAVASTLYTTLAAWQGVTSPNLAAAGLELNSLAGPAGYVSANDLHISPSSLAFNSGSFVPLVNVDIDGQPRPQNGLPDRGADETQGMGLFASFSGTPTSGSAPLSVAFTDLTFTSDPAGVQTWSWDFNNDGTVDSTLPNPTWIYSCPGSHTVSLTVTDTVNPPSTFVRSGYINVGSHEFSLSTSGGGVGDLTITPVPTTCGPAMGALFGYTLASIQTSGPVGAGPLFGIGFDPLTLAIITTPVGVDNPLHFVVTPSTYPNTGPVVYPPGVFSVLAGMSLDAIMVFQSPTGQLLHWTSVARVTF